jgi:hypothetical protein
MRASEDLKNARRLQRDEEIQKRAFFQTGNDGVGALFDYIFYLEGVVLDCEVAFTARRTRRARKTIYRTFQAIRVALMVAQARRRSDPDGR